jgi:hypothetical protein
MINIRDSFRLRKQMDVTWSVPEQQTGGNGNILNISLSGMAFETDKLFSPEHGMIINFSAAHIPPLPPKGKLLWFKKAGDKKHYQCGIKFLKATAGNPSWTQWMEDNILKLADTGDNKVLNHYLNIEEQE